MSKKKFLSSLQMLNDSYRSIIKNNIDLKNPEITDELSYENQKKTTLVNSIPLKINLLKKLYYELATKSVTSKNNINLNNIQTNLEMLENKQKDTTQSLKYILELIDITNKLIVDEKTIITTPIKHLPLEIRAELLADITELQKTFNSECYRSAVILCGRILEVALHRKYYEITQHDILEKSPGIGLGTLLAKMREKNIFFDPGLMNQIHMINMTRIFSVHKKQEPYHPTKDQTYAIIIYTLDILKRLFNK